MQTPRALQSATLRCHLARYSARRLSLQDRQKTESARGAHFPHLMHSPREARSRTLRLYLSSQTARQALQAVRPGTAECCPQTTQRPTARLAARRRLAASLSRFAVSGWQSAQRRRPGSGGTLPHSMQVERSARRRCFSTRARCAWRRAARQSSQLVLPSAGAFRLQRWQMPALFRSSRSRCLRARLASRSFVRQAAQRRGPGCGMAVPQSRQSPRFFIRRRRLRSDLRELARRRSMLSAQHLATASGGTMPQQLAASGGGSVSGGAKAGMQGMGRVSCWRKRARKPVGRPPAGHAPTTPSTPFRRTGRAPPFAGNDRWCGRPVERAGKERAGTDRGHTGRPAIGARSFGCLRTPWTALPAGGDRRSGSGRRRCGAGERC